MKATPEEPIQPEAIEPEVVSPETHVVRAPAVPVTLEELAATETGQEIVEARAAIWNTIRLSALRATSVQHHVLYRATDPDGTERITSFLEDAGCKCAAPLLGIEITPPGDRKDFEFVKIESADGEFAYSVTGQGKCHISGMTIYGVEGLRYSTDDFCKDLRPIMKEMRVRQAARANLDGNIVRALGGFKTIAVEELELAWKGTGKDWRRCAKGRGFGTRAQREGASVTSTATPADVPAPICEHASCNKTMEFRPGGSKDGRSWGAYWRCPLYQKGNGHSVLNDSDYRKSLAAATRDPGAEG